MRTVDILCLHLQVPFEALKRTTRDRKGFVDEFSAVLDTLQQQGGAVGQAAPAQRGDVLNDLDRRLSSLKRKVSRWTLCGCGIVDSCTTAAPLAQSQIGRQSLA